MFRSRLLGFLLLCFFSVHLSGQDCSNRANFNGFPAAVQDAIMDYTCEQVETHAQNMGIAHGVIFLQWHRDYIQGLEDHLSQLGYDDYVPLPAWNPCSMIPRFSLATCEGYPSMDLNLEQTTIDCGDFATSQYKDCSNFCDYDDFLDFQSELQTDHNGIHNTIDGTFSTAESPAVVLFWPWHAFIDDIYLKYQAANLDPSLDLKLEIVDQGCCEVTARIPKMCCLTDVSWVVDGISGSVSSTWIEDDYFYMTGCMPVSNFYRVEGTVTSTCGATRKFSSKLIWNLPSTPELPDFPPIDLERLCMNEGPYCYDFKNFKCLESLEVKTSSPKLIATVNGTQICLDYIWWGLFEGSITVTPTGKCGEGKPVIWTIYANQKGACKPGDGGPKRSSKDQNFKISNNSFSNELAVQYTGLDYQEVYTAALIDLNGRILQQQQGQHFSFDTSIYPAGLYLVRIVDENNELVFIQKHFQE